MAVIRGLVLGKFLPYHAGHAHLIRTARSQVDALTVLVCSIAREPIPGAIRFAWVAESHPDCRVVHVAEEVPQTPDEHPAFWSIWTDLVRCHAGDIDVVFTSEDYGDELARRLGARHVCVDRARTAYPVSGTDIRRDPLGHWDYIPPVVRPSYVHRIALLGTESTGKTTLAAQLASAFRTIWVPEYGRAYCEGRDALDLTLDDLDAIARGQIEAEESAARSANRVLVCDTDVRTTATWSDIIVGTRSAWLSRVAAEREYSHVLFLDDDVPWVDDGMRVLGDQRARHTALLEHELRVTGQVFTRIQGPFEQRFQMAAAAVENVVRMPVRPRFLSGLTIIEPEPDLRRQP
jgi:HTH-type transcriptional regulator, transcriptional repressor of NAD biosynthesis genes